MKNVKNYLMILMFMLVGVLSFGLTSSAETYVDCEGNPKTLEKLDTPYVNEDGEEVVYKKAKIKRALICRDLNFGMGESSKYCKVLAELNEPTITNEVYKTYWEMVDVNTGEVRYGGDWIDSDNKAYWDGCLIEHVPRGFTGTFYMRMRYAVGSKDDYIGDRLRYSEWSDKYYFVTQPTMLKAKKGDVKKSSIKVRWKKLEGNYTYIIYARKEQTNKVGYKWYKVGSTKKDTFTVKKINNKKINCKKYVAYHVKVVAQAKYEDKTIRSIHNVTEWETYKEYRNPRY